ncbi:hypothetical protein V8C34DRAFT_222849 [Trichoderma compactum]
MARRQITDGASMAGSLQYLSRMRVGTNVYLPGYYSVFRSPIIYTHVAGRLASGVAASDQPRNVKFLRIGPTFLSSLAPHHLYGKTRRARDPHRASLEGVGTAAPGLPHLLPQGLPLPGLKACLSDTPACLTGTQPHGIQVCDATVRCQACMDIPCHVACSTTPIRHLSACTANTGWFNQRV